MTETGIIIHSHPPDEMVNSQYSKRVKKSRRSNKAKDKRNGLRRTPEQREKAKKKRRRYRQNSLNKPKEKARAAIGSALRSGILKRPETCELCNLNPGRGSDGRSLIRADHHLGYDKENWLNVRWICVECDGKSQRKRSRKNNP